MAAPSEHRPKFCEDCDKRIYERRYAQVVARKLSASASASDPGMHRYPCPHGRGWHVGHTPAGKRRRDGEFLRTVRRPKRRRHRGRRAPVARRATPLAPGEDLAALAARMRGLPPPRSPR